MKKSFLLLSVALLGAVVCSPAIGQTNAATHDLSLGMPEINLLSSNSSTVNLELTTNVAGEAVQSSISDSTARVKISSVVAGVQSRTLSASVSAGSVPAGTQLRLVAKAPNANFGGTTGTLGSEATLSGSAANIITGIGSCFSGTGSDDGYVLKYTWGLDNPAATYGAVRAVSGGSSVTVTLTLSAGV